jgi:UDP-3-O-[3-hydroxymyristoyl] glucosamine N-acyltransferase
MITLRNVIAYLSEKMDLEIIYGNVGEDQSISKIIKFDPANLDNSILFWISEKNLPQTRDLVTGTLIAPRSIARPNNFNGTLLICENPRKAFSLIINEFFKPSNNLIPIGSLVTIMSNVPKSSKVGKGTIIEKGVTIGENVVIGYNNVILSGTVIGDNVKVGSNNTIGAVGFGYERGENGEYELISHIGNVVIEDDVEIGNNNCIDRAVLGSTLLCKNSKIDNLVHIAHGVKIGRNSLVIANSMIAGSSEIGDDVWIAPSTSVINGKTVGSRSMTGLGSVVISNVDEGSLVVGVPAKKIKDI